MIELIRANGKADWWRVCTPDASAGMDALNTRTHLKSSGEQANFCGLYVEQLRFRSPLLGPGMEVEEDPWLRNYWLLLPIY